MDLGKKIETLRKQKKMSQEQLADKLGVSRQSVFKWESSESTPGIDKLKELSKLFGVSLDVLLDDTKDLNEESHPQVENKSTTKIKYRTTFDSKIDVHISEFADIVHGYVDVNRPLNHSNDSLFEDLDKKCLERYEGEEVLSIQSDVPCYIVLDHKNRYLKVVAYFADQFLCPFENIQSIDLLDSGGRTIIDSIPISGAAVNIGGGVGFMGGSMPLVSQGASPHQVIQFTYYDKDEKLQTYKLIMDCYRKYIATKEYGVTEDTFDYYVDDLSNRTKNRFINVRNSIIAAIKKDASGLELKDMNVSAKADFAVKMKQYIDKVNLPLKQAGNQIEARRENASNVLKVIGTGFAVALAIAAIVLLVVFLKKYL